jgi:hypothetical protein
MNEIPFLAIEKRMLTKAHAGQSFGCIPRPDKHYKNGCSHNEKTTPTHYFSS